MSERIHCQKDTKIIYNYLRGDQKDESKEDFNFPNYWIENNGPFNNFKASDIFALAVALGYDSGKFKELDGVKDLSNPVNFESHIFPIIKSLAIFDSDEGINILNQSDSEIYKSSEEYANVGIHILFDEYQKDMDGIINEWHMEIDNIIKDKNILELIKEL